MSTQMSAERLAGIRAWADRFWGYVRKTNTCWLWTAYLDDDGYGAYMIRQDGSQWRLRAHRIAYVLIRGEIPDRMVLDHICRVKSCVNPDHLRVVDNRTNILAGIGATAINARKTHCNHGHEFTEENTYRTPACPGSRTCRECRRQRQVGVNAKRTAARRALRNAPAAPVAANGWPLGRGDAPQADDAGKGEK
jgi:hypothetical protein